MTAINVLLQRERAWIVTDAAWYDLEGVLTDIGPKTQAIPHWPAAVSIRGPGLAQISIATEAGFTFQDFDAFADGAADFLRRWCTRQGEYLDTMDPAYAHVEVIAAGWSKSRGRPRAFIVSSINDEIEMRSHNVGSSDRLHLAAEFEVFEIETGYMRPEPSPEAVKAVGLDLETDFDSLDVLSGLGTRVVCAQRMLREPLTEGGDPVCFVGGYVMITRVDRDGVHMCKGAAFPDVVGQRIEAQPDDVYWPHDDASEPTPAGPPPGLNRQQRRIWEAAQRKKGAGSVRAVR